jgi:hypothetical protein
MAPLLAIVFSSLASLLAIYTVIDLIFVLVPAVTFFTFHFTKFYKLKLRLLASLIVFIVVVFITAGLATNIVYQAHPTYETQLLNVNGNLTGNIVLASVTPYTGSSSSYTFQFYITPNGTLNYNSINLNIQLLGGGTKVVQYKQMTNSTFSGNNTVELTYSTPLSTGIYTYNLTAQSNISLHTPDINGPFSVSPFTFYVDILPTYALYYTIIYELVFLVGVFIARSMTSSRRYRQPQQPKQ